MIKLARQFAVVCLCLTSPAIVGCNSDQVEPLLLPKNTHEKVTVGGGKTVKIKVVNESNSPVEIQAVDSKIAAPTTETTKTEGPKTASTK